MKVTNNAEQANKEQFTKIPHWYNNICYSIENQITDKRTAQEKYNQIRKKEKEQSTIIFLSQNEIKVLAFLTSQANVLNKQHTEKQRSKKNKEDKFHFFCSHSFISEKLGLSIRTVKYCVEQLQQLNIITKYKSVRTSKWFINYQLLDELKAKFENKTRNIILTEKEIIQLEKKEKMNELQSLTAAYANEEIFDETIYFYNEIQSIANNKNLVPSQKEEQIQEVAHQYNFEVNNIRQQADNEIQILDKIKNNTLPIEEVKKLLTEYNQTEYFEKYQNLKKMEHDIYFEKNEDEEDKNYFGKIYCYINNDPNNACHLKYIQETKLYNN